MFFVSPLESALTETTSLPNLDGSLPSNNVIGEAVGGTIVVILIVVVIVLLLVIWLTRRNRKKYAPDRTKNNENEFSLRVVTSSRRSRRRAPDYAGAGPDACNEIELTTPYTPVNIALI